MAENEKLNGFYEHVQQTGKLRTLPHARRWSDGILRTLGFTLDRRTKKALAKALPEELAHSLTRVFWLVHFRNQNLSQDEFQKMSARRSGNTDAAFAYYPILAVFSGLKQMIDSDLDKQVANALPPEISKLWKEA
jgi:uncharacterized protein (DUF2267 family)